MVGQILFKNIDGKFILDISVQNGVLMYDLKTDKGFPSSLSKHLSSVVFPGFEMDYKSNRDIVATIRDRLQTNGCLILVSITHPKL